MKGNRRMNYSFVPDLSLIDPYDCTDAEDAAFRDHLRNMPPQPDPFSRVKYRFSAGHGSTQFMSVLELPDASPQPICEKRDNVARGNLEAQEVKSKTLGNSRRVVIYTPPHYQRMGEETYPLLIVFDGSAYLSRIPGHRILDNLIADGDIPPLIAAFVDPATDDPTARTRELMLGRDYANFIANEFIEWLRSRWRLRTEASANCLAGSSAGAVASSYLAFLYPDKFGKVLSQSGAYWVGPGFKQTNRMNSGYEKEWLVDQYAALTTIPARFFVEVGEYEAHNTMVASNRRFAEVLSKKSADSHYTEFPGGHDYACWRGSFAEGLRFLLGRE